MKSQAFSVFFVAFLLAGCSAQSPYVSGIKGGADQWSGASPQSLAETPSPSQWWAALNDPAVNALIDAAYASSPTLEQALARIDEARAQFGVAKADFLPNVAASAGAAQAYDGSAVTNNAKRSTSANIGPSLSWEIDLFGRIRTTTQAAQSRLDARTADAANTRLSLGAQVADTMLNLRDCRFASQVLSDEIASRNKTLALLRLKTSAGFSPPVDEASANRDLENVRVRLGANDEACARNLNALVALSGLDKKIIESKIALPLVAHNLNTQTPIAIPIPPASSPQMPAIVLAGHPAVIAADRDAAAAWAEIGAAKADRLPKLDLTALLTGQWIRTAGTTLDFVTWSLSPALSAPLFDGGRGAASVDAAEARYRQAAAALQSTIRTTAQDVENALSAQQYAQERLTAAENAVKSGEVTLIATEAQWKNGTASLFELEDARRQLSTAQGSAIDAARDRAQAWVALILATGNSALTMKEPSQ